MLYYTLFKTLGVPETKEGDASELGVSVRFSHFTLPCPCQAIVKHCNAQSLFCDGEVCSLVGSQVICPGVTYNDCQEREDGVYCDAEKEVCDYLSISSYKQKKAAAPQWVAVRPDEVGDSFNACPDTMLFYPNWNDSDALGDDSPLTGKMNGAVYELRIGDAIFDAIQDFTPGSDYYYPVTLWKNFDEEDDYYTSDVAGLSSVYCYGNVNCDFCSIYLKATSLTITDVLDCADYIADSTGFVDNVTYWCGVEV
jgi:hypothetical protein